jgi:hypothetical protein
MPPLSRVITQFAAEPPQDGEPYGRWRERLRGEFLAAAQGLDEEAGEIGEITFYPDRSWHGRTFIPASAPTDRGMEVYGFVVFVPADDDGEEPSEFGGHADYTDDTAERHPEWKLDLSDEVIGAWRGEGGKVAAMTLVWGRALVAGGETATAELGPVTVDQCTLVADRFTLIAPDDYGGDLLEVRLWSASGGELALESLYDEDDE